MANYNILKFGGTSVGTPEAMEIMRDETLRIHNQSLEEDGDSVTNLIPSATGKQKTGSIRDKTTDLSEEILRGKNVKDNKDEIWRREQRIVEHFGLPEDFNKRNFGLLENYLDESIPNDQKYSLVTTIVGERLKAAQSVEIFNLIEPGSAIFLDYDKTGVITTGGFRNAKKTSSTYDSIYKVLSKPEYKGKILVLGGFMGIDEDSKEVTTLGRGGSDTHAVWIASAMKDKRAYIYSDTSLRRADPKIVPDAEIIPAVTYSEMGEFIGFAASILAGNANEAAEESLLELVLRNTFDLKQGETVVSSKKSNGYGGIKGVAACPAVLLALGNLPNIPGAYNQVTGILDKYNIGFMNEAGDLRRSSMVLTGTPDKPLEKMLEVL